MVELSNSIHTMMDVLNPESPSTKPSSVGYRVEFRDRTTGELLLEREVPNPDIGGSPSIPDNTHPFLIISTYHTTKETLNADKTTQGGVVGSLSTVSSKRMLIRSPAIIHALRSVVTYYPGQDMTGDVLEIEEPYAILIHHYEELWKYQEKCAPGTERKLCHREVHAHAHLKELRDFLDVTIMPQVTAERERNARGYTIYHMFWLHFKPGSTIIAKNWGEEEETASVVHSVYGGVYKNPQRSWEWQGWALAFDGTELGRTLTDNSWPKFDGEVEFYFRVLDVTADTHDESVLNLVKRGKTYWSLLKKQCKYYKGKARLFPHSEIDGLVMPDVTTFFTNQKAPKPRLLESGDSRNWISDCACPVCKERRDHTLVKSQFIFANYEDIDPQCDEATMTDHHYLLCPPGIMAYVFGLRRWECLTVANFQEAKYNEQMIDHLVMDQHRKDMLQALAKSFARFNQLGEKTDMPPWTADFVPKKGSGLIFLLHGRPGVGKTCTAECIASFAKRPLMTLTSSDIGTDPRTVEYNLAEKFDMAKSWGAVMLIDEADVFMERRTTADLTRNSLVAGFLRALEYYDGILFLTTNRIGSFDDAFVSRVHVQLYYPDFDDNSRNKVWQTFIDKLEQERGDYMRLNIDAKEYLEGGELKALKWNGREIRNAFQTAVSLAEYEAKRDREGRIVLTDKHFKAVVAMSRDFKNYLNKLHQGDEAKRAERRFERLND